MHSCNMFCTVIASKAWVYCEEGEEDRVGHATKSSQVQIMRASSGCPASQIKPASTAKHNPQCQHARPLVCTGHRLSMTDRARPARRHPGPKAERLPPSGEVGQEVRHQGCALDDGADEGGQVGLAGDGEVERQGERAEVGAGEGEPFGRGDVLEVSERALKDGETGGWAIKGERIAIKGERIARRIYAVE